MPFLFLKLLLPLEQKLFSTHVYLFSVCDLAFCILDKMPAAAAKLLQSYPTLCNPIDGSSPGSSIPGILQARIPEWVAIS